MEQQSATSCQRVFQLAQEGKTGSEIARTMQAEKFSLTDTWEALLNAGYAAKAVEQPDGSNTLRVSDYPVQTGLLALIAALANPEKLPAVAWEEHEDLSVP